MKLKSRVNRVSSCRPRGFTLIEIMIVLSIIMLLVGLLLPSVQQAREAARRTQCKNHLMQLGLALNNYMNAHRVLPPGTSNPSGPIVSKENVAEYHMGWISQILPFIEQQNASRRIDFTQGVYSPVNQPARAHVIPGLRCPSDSGQWLGSTGAAVTNYSGIHNDVETSIDVNQNGVLFLNSSIRFDQITDGCSSTILVGEVSSQLGLDLGWMTGTRSSLRNVVLPMTAPTSGDVTDFKIHPSPMRNATVSIREQPNAPADGTEFVGGLSSAHSGFQVVFCDGSVRLMSTHMDARTLRNLAHRSDGEMVGEF